MSSSGGDDPASAPAPSCSGGGDGGGDGAAAAEEEAVTMLDVLKDEEELEEHANAVLGAADQDNCTYPQGYVGRQPVYACLSCAPWPPASPDFRPAGVCLACSYACHEGHQLVELYTKRCFRCDCGNDRLENKCKLVCDKDTNNDKNKYSQNFGGSYCTCGRPYPDPEDPIDDDEMVQCIICEDWYHGRHLHLDGGEEARSPDANLYAEMVCVACCKTLEFPSAYAGLSVNRSKVSNADETVDVVTGSGDSAAAAAKAEEDSLLPERRTSGLVAPDNAAAADAGGSSDTEKCVLAKSLLRFRRQSSGGASRRAPPSTLFLPAHWRSQLCRCNDCRKTYKDKAVEFLLDVNDTVHAYEDKGRNGRDQGSQYEKNLAALSNLDRVQQVEAIHSYNDMKSNLMAYLNKFAQNKKVVRQEDIAEFFEQMKANKRQKVEIPRNCR